MSSLEPLKKLPQFEPFATPPALKKTSGQAEKLVIKRRNLFWVSDARGEITPEGARDLGLFYNDTRFLSYYHTHFPEFALELLSSAVSPHGLMQVDLTAPPVVREEVGLESQRFLHIRRIQLLDGELVDALVITNYLGRPADIRCAISFANDFADLFEVRGMIRDQRGEALPPEVDPKHKSVTLGYQGRDQRLYRTRLSFLSDLEKLSPNEAILACSLEHGESRTLEIRATPLVGEKPAPPRKPIPQLISKAREDSDSFHEERTSLECDNELFSQTIYRALSDIHDLLGVYGECRVPTAGIPWYATPFGRDSIWTSLQTLPFYPEMACQVLRFLAAHQGKVVDQYREEEPGKIFHEIRSGELAHTGEIPHSPYYGSIDATPLFLVLLEETHRWTGDDALVRELLPAARAALHWIDRYGDLDGDGFVEYQRISAGGLANQGWKDSHDGILFPDGRQPLSPIALVEVQGYVYDAKTRFSRLLRGLGEHEAAEALSLEAKRLRRRIEEAFWLDSLGTYALALDGEKRPLDTVASNAGHLLFSRVPLPQRAERVAEHLLGPEMWSGWGVRTLSSAHAPYNPLSYHNGSVWPHDNAIIALGLSYYGMGARAERILTALFEASKHFRSGRLPELFSGLERGEFDFPAQYPVACNPQAWAVGTWFMLLQAVLGFQPDTPAGVLHIRSPRLPPWLRELRLRNMRVGKSRVSLRFVGVEHRCFVDVLEVQGAPIRIQIDL